ncbi:protein of unknown function [Candidatus Methylacidiphilum fumarolicum]|uniref:FAD:protein FMN transferase n=1 Tax=Candidatus Methylacidiphilum fumarolicum TaxID=591154 RepID=A0ABM9IBI9_9BACT|nr:protein of unknown function [Candidatus Methylacidiphilum fumarolicum]
MILLSAGKRTTVASLECLAAMAVASVEAAAVSLFSGSKRIFSNGKDDNLFVMEESWSLFDKI